MYWTIHKFQVDLFFATCSIPCFPPIIAEKKRREKGAKKIRTFTFVHGMKIGFWRPKCFRKELMSYGGDEWSVVAGMTLKNDLSLLLALLYIIDTSGDQYETKSSWRGEGRRVHIYWKSRKSIKGKLLKKYWVCLVWGWRARVLVSRENSLTAFSVVYETKYLRLIVVSFYSCWS